MARALIIDGSTKQAVREAIDFARANPISRELLMASAHKIDTKLTLADRRPDLPPRPPSAQVLIPFGFRAALSFEDQPAGISCHLSISLDTPGLLPIPLACQMIAEEFGFNYGDMINAAKEGNCSIWLEEFAPGHEAVNILWVEQQTVLAL